MVLKIDFRGSSRLSRGADEALMQNAIDADIGLVLVYDRHWQNSRFRDDLRLHLSDLAKAESAARYELQKTHLGYVGFRPAVGSIEFFGAEDAKFPRRFYKRTEQGVFVADQDRVVAVGKKIISSLEGILQGIVIDASVQGLDYFWPANRQGLVDVRFTPFYNTNYEDTRGFKRWVMSL